MSFLIKTYVLALSLVGFISMVYDKKLAVTGKCRIRESRLLLIAALGGAAGSLVGMFLAWHKIRKPKFVVLVPCFFAIQVGIIYFLETNGYI